MVRVIYHPVRGDAVAEAPRLFRDSTGARCGVDWEAAILRGYVVAELGPFKSGRGEFDRQSLAGIVQMMRAAEPHGVRSRYGHPQRVTDDVNLFLGWSRNARLDGDLARADLHFDRMDGLAKRVLDLAERAPWAIGSSLDASFDDVRRVDAGGRPLRDSCGELLPAIWRPRRIYASDIVNRGDAVRCLLPKTDSQRRYEIERALRGSNV